MSIRETYVRVREAAGILGVAPNYRAGVGSSGEDPGVPTSRERTPTVLELRVEAGSATDYGLALYRLPARGEAAGESGGWQFVVARSFGTYPRHDRRG